MYLFEAANSDMVFGLPETADVLIFGLVLIFLTGALRRFFKQEKSKSGN